MSEEEIVSIGKQILEGIEYLHEKGFLHRDLKPENFVINSQTLEVKIIDLGTIKDIRSTSPPYSTYISTRWYRAPECVLRSDSYGPPSDIFAIGCLVAELFNGVPLFPGSSESD